MKYLDSEGIIPTGQWIDILAREIEGYIITESSDRGAGKASGAYYYKRMLWKPIEEIPQVEVNADTIDKASTSKGIRNKIKKYGRY